MLPCIYLQWLPTWYIQMFTVQWGCWLLTPLEWVAGLGMGTSTARGARFPVPNRSYPAEREPARSSPIHPIARLSGSERLRRSTAKFLLALLYIKHRGIITNLTIWILGGILPWLLLCQNTTMRVYGAWIRIHHIYVQKHIAPLAICSNLVHDKPLEVPIFVKRAYSPRGMIRTYLSDESQYRGCQELR